MRKTFLAATLAILATSPFVLAQDKPAIVVHTFTATPGQPWPYDQKKMTAQTAAELLRQDGKRFHIAAESSADQGKTSTLDRRVTQRQPRNRAKSRAVGLGTGS